MYTFNSHLKNHLRTLITPLPSIITFVMISMVSILNIFIGLFFIVLLILSILIGTYLNYKMHIAEINKAHNEMLKNRPTKYKHIHKHNKHIYFKR